MNRDEEEEEFARAVGSREDTSSMEMDIAILSAASQPDAEYVTIRSPGMFNIMVALNDAAPRYAQIGIVRKDWNAESIGEPDQGFWTDLTPQNIQLLIQALAQADAIVSYPN